MKPEDKTEQFISLLAKEQRKVYSFILSAVSQQSAAEEIMQQTLFLMWRNFSRFEKGTNFGAWGKAIAKYEIFNYRKKKGKDFFLDLDSLERVMDASVKSESISDQRMKALEGCCKKLSEKNRLLIHCRYSQGLPCTDISRKMNHPISTIYKMLARLHASLQECVRRTLSIWETQP